MKNWSLNTKVGFVMSILALAAIAIGYFGVTRMALINNMLVELVNVDVKRNQLTSDLLDTQRQYSVIIRDLRLAKSDSRKTQIESVLHDTKALMFKTLETYDNMASKDGKELAAQYKTAMEKWFSINEEITRLDKAKKDDEASVMMDKDAEPARAKAMEILESMNKLTSKRLESAVTSAEASYNSARTLVVAISFFSTLAGILLAFIIMRAVSKAIDKVIASLNDNSAQVTSAAQQIAASSEQLSQAATEQASSLEETSSSIEEMNSMVQKNSENARKSADISTTSHQSATRGKEVVQDMIKAIEGINDSNQQIAEIVKVIAEIGNKTKVINDIVFQTKLLSFNASVEAARAGEHGKGFAVVAEEVGKLAQMSGNAAKEISTMLDGSLQKVEGIVNETKTKVEGGTKVAQQCGEVLEEIVGNVSSVNQMVGEISTACQEQSQGVQEITRAMSQLDQVTQENAATSEEAASAAEELAAQAESLRNVVKTLIQTVKGGNQGGSHDVGTAAPRAAVSAKKAEKTAPDHGENGKVVHLKAEKKAVAKKSAEAHHSNGNGMKKAVGFENGVPSEDDPRFSDV